MSDASSISDLDNVSVSEDSDKKSPTPERTVIPEKVRTVSVCVTSPFVIVKLYHVAGYFSSQTISHFSAENQ